MLTDNILETHSECSTEHREILQDAILKIQQYGDTTERQIVKSEVYLSQLLPITNVAIDNTGDRYMA